jgi:hypothetical protein
VGLEALSDRKCAAGGEWGGISIVEVVVRPPEVFVRPPLHDEAVRLKRSAKRAKHESTRQRAAILLASNVRMSAPQIAEMWRTDPSWAQGHPRVQRAGDGQPAPSLPGRASPPDHDD